MTPLMARYLLNGSKPVPLGTYACGRCPQPHWNAAVRRPVHCPRCSHPARLLAVVHRVAR
jgi:DNA-directed RNA polymerase subunit RPC12/RpoP